MLANQRPDQVPYYHIILNIEFIQCTIVCLEAPLRINIFVSLPRFHQPFMKHSIIIFKLMTPISNGIFVCSMIASTKTNNSMAGNTAIMLLLILSFNVLQITLATTQRAHLRTTSTLLSHLLLFVSNYDIFLELYLLGLFSFQASNYFLYESDNT